MQQQAASGGADNFADSMSAVQVDEAWRALLEECLPDEDKRKGLMIAYEQESDPRTRYSMLVEFSSYLRQASMRLLTLATLCRLPAAPQDCVAHAGSCALWACLRAWIAKLPVLAWALLAIMTRTQPPAS